MAKTGPVVLEMSKVGISIYNYDGHNTECCWTCGSQYLKSPIHDPTTLLDNIG